MLDDFVNNILNHILHIPFNSYINSSRESSVEFNEQVLLLVKLNLDVIMPLIFQQISIKYKGKIQYF